MTALINVQSRLAAATADADVPGASVAVLYDNAVHVAATGLANVPAGIEITPDTVFQIGSITKAFTATLIMQLVDDRFLTLDDTLDQLLPELALDRPEATSRITVAHLLSHTSGIDGDRLVDTGCNDDYLARFIDSCAGTPLIHEPGELFSYCNVGYILLGRIIEKRRGHSWDDVLAERILEPLGLRNAGTRLEDLIRRRIALGHSRRRDGTWQIESLWPRSNSPSGSRLAMTATELTAFAGAHLAATAGGRESIISSASARKMQSRVVEIPYAARQSAWGLGWMHFDAGERLVVGHDGGVAGTTAFLRLVPDRALAVALLINGPGYRQVFEAVVPPLLSELADIDERTAMPTPDPDVQLELPTYCGVYRRHGLTLRIWMDANALMALPGGEFGDPEAEAFELKAATHEQFVARLPGTEHQIGIYFSNFEADGRPRYVQFMERAYRRSDA